MWRWPLWSGDLSLPVTVTVKTQAGTATAGADFVASTNVIIFTPGESRKIVFLLGEGRDLAHARKLIDLHGQPKYAVAALEKVQKFWDRTLKAIKVRTPDDSFDTMMNQWLLYQDISSRLWTRAGFLTIHLPILI